MGRPEVYKQEPADRCGPDCVNLPFQRRIPRSHAFDIISLMGVVCKSTENHKYKFGEY